MLERNRPTPALPSTPSLSGDWLEARAAGGLFASAEDYDATGILAGVDLCESRYWWMPDLFASPAAAGELATADGLPLPGAALTSAGSLPAVERLRRPGQATRRNGSRRTAAA